MRLWLATIGLISMLAQVILLRELSVAFFGSELIYVLALGVWMLLTAAGAAWGGKRLVVSEKNVRIGLLVLSIALPLSLVMARALRPVLNDVPGAYLPFDQQLAAMVAVLLPCTMLLGLLFQWAAKLFVSTGQKFPHAYAIESAGGIAGGLLATTLLAIGLSNLTAAFACSIVAALAGWYPHASAPRWLAPVALLSCLVMSTGIVLSGRIDSRLTRLSHPNLVETRDSPYNRVTVTASGDQVAVFANDALVFETQGTAAQELAHLAAVHHPNPREILILGGGLAGLVEHSLQHEPSRIDYVEINRTMVDMVKAYLPEHTQSALADERVRLIIEDPRAFLSETSRAYDLIIVGMPDPDSGQTNRFYTREFFAECNARLSSSGVIVFALSGSDNLWSPQLLRRNASIYQALDEVFAHVAVLPAHQSIYVASQSSWARDEHVFAQRLEEKGIHSVVSGRYLGYLYGNDRFTRLNAKLRRSDMPHNSDSRPVCYQYTLLLWLARFYPVLAVLSFTAESSAAAAVLALALVGAAIAMLALLLRRRAHLASVVLVGLVGFAGMVVETVLILHYQTVRGVLFQDLGLLLTAFMAGLTLGSLMVPKLAPYSEHHTRHWWLLGLSQIGLLAACAGLTGWLVGERGHHGSLLAIIALFLTGLAVAGAFAFASLRAVADQRAVVSPLYASDLAGGCIGSLLATLVLVPGLGLFGSASAALGAAALALLLI